MSQLVREYFELPTQALAALVASDKATPFQPSELYLPTKGCKYYDEGSRVSVFRRLRSKEIFEACGALIDAISADDAACALTLLRNDATHLRYEPGGFFKVRADFL